MGKVMVLVVGILVLGALAAPAGAYSYTSSWSSSPYGTFYNGNPLGSLGGLGGTDLSSIYGPSGPFGGLGGLSSLGGYGSYGGFGSMPGMYSGLGGYGGFGSMLGGYSPFGSTSGGSSTDLGQVSPTSDLFSNVGSSGLFGNMFGGSLFKAKQYGTPPTDTIRQTLIGQMLSYNSGNMGIPLQYKIEDSDIGAITGTQYQGADAWNVRVGQQGMYWDVILDSTGKNILSETQVQ